MSHTAPIKKVKDKIIINFTLGEGGKDLHQCYFLPANHEPDGVYNFFDKESRILAANIVSGQNFNFTVDGIHFEISKFQIDPVAASGKWRNDAPERAADPRFASDQEGSFQAGSGPVEEGEDGKDSYSTATA